MSLRIRVLAAAGLIALVSAATFAVMLDSLLEQRGAATAATNTTDALTGVADVQRLALDLETGVRGYVLTADRSFLAPYENARRELPGELARLAAVPNDPVQRARIVRLRRDLGAYTDYLAGVVSARRSPPASAREGKARFDAIRATLGAIDASERAEQAQRRAHSARLRERAITTAAVGGVLLLALIALLAYGA